MSLALVTLVHRVGVPVVILGKGARTTQGFKLVGVLGEQLLRRVDRLRAIVAVEAALVLLLQIGLRILENSNAVLASAVDLRHLNSLLGARQTLVKHVLVVADELHLALVLGVEVLLAGREVVLFVRESGSVALLAGFKGRIALVVVAQLVEVGALAVASAVHGPESAAVLRNVGVSAASVVRIHYGLRVNVRSTVGGPRLLNSERPYKDLG